jgi:radical SAM superfamily enzyme YgiQ (UPF0313 family)
LYLVSNCDKKIDFIDNRIDCFTDNELYEKFKNFDIVAFGGTVTEVKQARTVARLLRESGVTTIYGGPNATINYEAYLNDFDIIIRGEGEITFAEVLGALEKERPLDMIQGISFQKNNKISNNPDRPYIQDLDTLKYPAREILNIEKYSRDKPTYLHQAPMDTVISSRGCPFICTFCASKLIWKQTRRRRSAEAVVDEIRYIMEKFGTRSIYFREDLFTLPRQWIFKFCELVKPLGIEWMCESRIDTVDKEMLQIMKGSGCTGMWFGIESCSEKTLALIKKRITKEQVKKTIKNCNETGIVCGGTFIFGFPHENRDDIIKNFDDAQKLGLNRIGFNRLIGFPRSELYEIFIKEGLNRYEYEGIIIPDTRHMHADEVNALGYEKFPEIMEYNESHTNI